MTGDVCGEIRDRVAEHATVRMLGIHELYVGCEEDQLVLQYLEADEAFMQQVMHWPGWSGEYNADPRGFVERLVHRMAKRLPMDVWDAKGMLDRQYLFLRMHQDLGRTCHSSDDYDLLRVAGLLRSLMVESLAVRVAKHVKVNLSFKVGRVIPDPPRVRIDSKGRRMSAVIDGPRFMMAGPQFDPEFFDGESTTVSVDELRKLTVVRVEQYLVTAHDFVKHMANVYGTIHAGEPKKTDAMARALALWRRLLVVGGRQPGLDTLAAIGRVVYKGLAPAADSVSREFAPG